MKNDWTEGDTRQGHTAMCSVAGRSESHRPSRPWLIGRLRGPSGREPPTRWAPDPGHSQPQDHLHSCPLSLATPAAPCLPDTAVSPPWSVAPPWLLPFFTSVSAQR
jgi:hypothetical protein